MKTYGLVWVALIVVGIALAGARWLRWTPSQPLSVAASRHGPSAQPEVQAQELSLIVQTGATVTWRILAARAVFSPTRRHTLVHRIDAQIAGDTPEAWRMTARRGVIDSVTGDMVIEGRVRLQQRQGYAVDVDKLYWDAGRRLLYTDTPVKIRGASVAITGRGLQSQVDQRRLTVEHQVRARFQLREPR